MRKRSEITRKDLAEDDHLPGDALQTSAALAKELEKNQAPDEFSFQRANAARYEPLRPDVQRIVDSTFVEDVWPAFERAEAFLKQSSRGERGHLEELLDAGEAVAREMHRVWMTAEYEMGCWQRENEVLFSSMRLEADRALQAEKDSKQRNKAITDNDVRMMAAQLFGDEWSAQEARKQKVELGLQSAKNLFELVVQRIKTLQGFQIKQR